jgi:hypothetical protein
LRGGKQEKFLRDDVSGVLKLFLPTGAGVAQVQLSAAVADTKFVSNNLSHEEIACSKKSGCFCS